MIPCSCSKDSTTYSRRWHRGAWLAVGPWRARWWPRIRAGMPSVVRPQNERLTDVAVFALPPDGRASLSYVSLTRLRDNIGTVTFDTIITATKPPHWHARHAHSPAPPARSLPQSGPTYVQPNFSFPISSYRFLFILCLSSPNSLSRVEVLLTKVFV